MVTGPSVTGQVACWYPNPRLAFPVTLWQAPSHTGVRGCCKALLGGWAYMWEAALWTSLAGWKPLLNPSSLQSSGTSHSEEQMSRTMLSVKICLINIHLRSTKIITNKIHHIQHLQEGDMNLSWGVTCKHIPLNTWLLHVRTHWGQLLGLWWFNQKHNK